MSKLSMVVALTTLLYLGCASEGVAQFYPEQKGAVYVPPAQNQMETAPLPDTYTPPTYANPYYTPNYAPNPYYDNTNTYPNSYLYQRQQYYQITRPPPYQYSQPTQQIRQNPQQATFPYHPV